MVDTNFCINIVRRQRKGPLWEGGGPKGRRERALSASEASDFGKALSPTRFAGLLRSRSPLSLARHLPTLWGVTLPEGAIHSVPTIL